MKPKELGGWRVGPCWMALGAAGPWPRHGTWTLVFLPDWPQTFLTLLAGVLPFLHASVSHLLQLPLIRSPANPTADEKVSVQDQSSGDQSFYLIHHEGKFLGLASGAPSCLSSLTGRKVTETHLSPELSLFHTLQGRAEPSRLMRCQQVLTEGADGWGVFLGAE